MVWKRTLAEKIFNISKISPPQTLTNCRISSPAVLGRIPQSAAKSGSSSAIAPEPGDNGSGIFRRFLHKRAVFSPAVGKLPIGEGLVEKLRGMGFGKDRINLEGLTPPISEKSAAAVAAAEEKSSDVIGLTVDDARKLLWVAQLEVVKTSLRETGKIWISYPEYLKICREGCLDPEEGNRISRLLDECGTVVVLGNIVVLRPEQVAKVLGGLIPLPGSTSLNDPRKRELEALENQKAAIDKTAESLVRRELWGGLGYLVVQTTVFMRLTFWELSWDVMEPICFYVTSMYLMAGYAFFLRTSREPSFEGIYQSRFSTKQKKLMKAQAFDIHRYNELRGMFYPNISGSSSSSLPSSVQIGAVDY